MLGQILNNPLNDTVIESAVFESDIPDRLIMVPVNFVRDDASDYLVSCNLISHFDVLKADILPILRSQSCLINFEESFDLRINVLHLSLLN